MTLVNARRTLLIAALAAALLTAGLPVWAHTSLVSTEPAAGATVPTGLATLTLTFDEPLDPASQAAVFAGQFEPVAIGSQSIDGPTLLVSLRAPLSEGTYTVQWLAAGRDGHPVEGSYQFAVKPRPGAGLGPAIALGTSLLAGSLALAATLWLARRRKPRADAARP